VPGPVSDSYDPEFGTGANAHDVWDAAQAVSCRIAEVLGPKLKNIVQVSQGPPGSLYPELEFCERELRVIRFCINRALESI
jgi:hypothetical protein